MGVVQGFSWFRSNIRRALLLLILAVLLPVLGLLVFTFVAQLNDAFDDEMLHDLALARAVGEAFEEHVLDITRQELATGTALTSLESFTAPQANQYLKTAAAGFASVISLDWLTPEAAVIASSNPSVGGPDPRSQPWFREVLADPGRPFVISDLLPGQSSGDFGFTIARGIRDANGKLLGVIAARGDVGRMELRGLPGVLAYRRPEAALTLEQRQWRGNDPHLDEALAGRESSGRLRSPIDGADLITARVPVKSLGWVVGAGRPYDEVMHPLYRSLAVNLATMLVIAAVSVLLANLISRSVTRPLGRLRIQAIAIGKGNLDYRTEVRGIAELEELSGVRGGGGRAPGRRERVAGEVSGREPEPRLPHLRRWRPDVRQRGLPAAARYMGRQGRAASASAYPPGGRRGDGLRPKRRT
jgi:HAMP domain-containing protein